MTTEVRSDGWAAHRDLQRRAFMAATPSQRLRWLEDAIRFVSSVGALERRIDSGSRERQDRTGT